jgi:CRISPR-associated endonuclease/helicase Cas3
MPVSEVHGEGELKAEHFAPFFKAIYDTDPFAWQAALAERVLDGRGWPDAIDVPTGLGKTAVIDIAVFALAAQATMSADARTAPTRTFMVVDRRVIVDQAFERAKRLRDALEGGNNDEIVRLVARRLLSLSAGIHVRRALRVVRMRGGTSWSSAWLGSPAQPAVVCGTVDQIGSRLLFRGYGVGQHRRSIDAALVGTDSLWLLDEAHLALPLISTRQSVSDEEDLASHQVLASRRPRSVLLSATLPLGRAAPADVLRLDPAAETSPAARDRLSVRRLVRLVDLRAKDTTAFVQAVSEAARRAAAKPGVTRVLAVVNTVATARAVFDRLGPDPVDSDEPPEYTTALLTGRCRPVERELLARRFLLPPDGRLAAGAERVEGEPPVIAVATQTVEVGADLDVDALVTECCPMDALLQRLGRLDRRGRLGTSEAVVVHQSARHADPAAAVYGPAIERTWAWLVEHARPPVATASTGDKLGAAIDDAPLVDLGPAGIAALLAPAERGALASEPPLAPVALGSQLAAWARTSPVPVPDQDVAPFLHGIEHSGASVQVCWRAVQSDDAETWADELKSAPVGAHETVSIALGEMRRFLSGRSVATGSDVEGADPDDEVGAELDDPFEERIPVKAWVVPPAGTVSRCTDRLLRPGVTVVVPASAGGHDIWGWTGRADHNLVADVADLGRAVPVRLRREVFESLLPGADIPRLPCAADDDTDATDVAATVKELADLARTRDPSMSPHASRLAERLDVVVSAPAVRIGRGHPTMWWLLRAKRSFMFDSVSDEDSVDVITSVSMVPVDLDQHLRDVEGRAREVATTIGLSMPLRRAVALAGLVHDLGKADRRFQSMLHGGSALRAEASGRILAKSGMDPADRSAFRQARERSHWPEGMRHEAISAAIVESLSRDRPEVFDGVDGDLVRHLVASHHGRSRPLLPPVADDASVDVSVAVPGFGDPIGVRSNDLLVDWSSPGRFERLGRSYGWWGLALLEAVVRLADQTVSQEYGLPEDDEILSDEEAVDDDADV